MDTASNTEPNSPADLCARTPEVVARVCPSVSLQFADEDREFQALLDSHRVVDTEPKWFRSFIDDCFAYGSTDSGTAECRASKMSVPLNRIHRTLKAVHAGIAEGANLRVGLAAG